MASLEIQAQRKLTIEGRLAAVSPTMQELTGHAVDTASAPLSKFDDQTRQQLIASMANDATLAEAVVILAQRVDALEAELTAQGAKKGKQSS